MASPSLLHLLAALLLALVSFPGTAAGAGGHLQPAVASSPSPAGFSPQPPREPAQQAAAILVPVLSNLGFQELAMAVPGLSSPLLSVWSGPITIFAPSDDSVRSCISCSPTRILREHLVPGLFSHVQLSTLAFGTKLETSSPGRCLTVTSTAGDASGVKIFVDGGFVGPLSPLSCNQSPGQSPPSQDEIASASVHAGSTIVRLMLRDAIVQLKESGYSILALAMRVKYPELSTLQNMTIFALDDAAIFAGGHSYVTNVRFHVVPNRLLMYADLMKLRAGTILSTLVHGQSLVITHAHTGDTIESGLRINYVPISRPDVVCNLKVVVHSIFLPFPHLLPSDMPLLGGVIAADSIFEPPAQTPAGVASTVFCDAAVGLRGCSAPTSPVDFDDSL
ncbi:unnamed protein product [Spirodela intermedia]|uniref:FAS1 domain-containing protein n=1 Tax=Spirodela intermedia TaxID=51605 RepID=A0A7I8ITV0_SPIIN|nr:unnamed protein product [Spirodela intermedia]CAA6661416.1 unnamed protein product [Spirodela intermedia]